MTQTHLESVKHMGFRKNYIFSVCREAFQAVVCVFFGIMCSYSSSFSVLTFVCFRMTVTSDEPPVTDDALGIQRDQAAKLQIAQEIATQAVSFVILV